MRRDPYERVERKLIRKRTSAWRMGGLQSPGAASRMLDAALRDLEGDSSEDRMAKDAVARNATRDGKKPHPPRVANPGPAPSRRRGSAPLKRQRVKAPAKTKGGQKPPRVLPDPEKLREPPTIHSYRSVQGLAKVDEDGWGPVPGWPGLEAHVDGKARAWFDTRDPSRLLSSPQEIEPYIRPNKGSGYRGIPIYDPAQEKQVMIGLARLVYSAHRRPVPPRVKVRFADGDSANCKLSNLYVA